VSAAEAAGCSRVSFGRHVLRVETAAVAAAARLA
jgi:16S rRNA U1498 N3-methylase RsmE